MNGINVSRKPYITQLLGAKPSSLTQWESSSANGHQMIDPERAIVNAANLAHSANDPLSTVIDDMTSIRDLIITRQLSSDIRHEEDIERAEAEKLLSQVKEKIINSNIELKQVDFGSSGIESAADQQGNVMKLEEHLLEELGLMDLDIDDADFIEKLDLSIEKVSTFTDEGKFNNLLKMTKDKSDFIRSVKVPTESASEN